MIILKADFPEKFKAESQKIIDNLKEAGLNENGELPFPDIKEVKNEDVFKKTKESLDESEKTVLIGDEHSLTKEAFSAFKENFKRPGLILFDSSPYTSGFIKELIEEKKIEKNNIILIGTRRWNKDEYNYLKQNNLKSYSMKEICVEGMHEICDSIMSVARMFDALYISIGIGVVDPAFAPAAKTTEPAGLSSRELVYFLQRLKLLKNLRAIDLIGFEQEKDINNITALLCAKIIGEVC